ncbi:MAG: hypothetical protein AB7H96_19000 [Vicinamibacterales bacterium]
MPDTPRNRPDDAPTDASAMEQAEGSRQNLDDPSGAAQDGAGITNRPLDDEQDEQARVPPRGERRESTSHA